MSKHALSLSLRYAGIATAAPFPRSKNISTVIFSDAAAHLAFKIRPASGPVSPRGLGFPVREVGGHFVRLESYRRGQRSAKD